MPALAGHQPDPLYPKNPGDRLETGPQGLELQIDQVGTMQVDRVALVAADLAPGHVDTVIHQQVEDVAKDADAVLAVHFDTHEKARKDERDGSVGIRTPNLTAFAAPSDNFLRDTAVFRKDYVTDIHKTIL